MTTWLRVLVERRARRANPSFSLSLSLSPTVFYLKHFYSFSNQQKTQHWYFGNWLQINNQQQYTWYTITTNHSQLPCGYTSCLVLQDTCCLPPSIYVLLQVCIIGILIQYQEASYSILFIVQYIYCLLLTTNCLYSCLQIIEPHLLGLSYYHLLGSQSNIMQYHNIINTIPHSTSIMYVILLQTITK